MLESELLYQADLSEQWVHDFVVESNKIDPQPGTGEPGTLVYDGHRNAVIYAIEMAAESRFALPNAVHKLLLCDHPLAGKLRKQDIKIGLNYILEARFVPYLIWEWNRLLYRVINTLRTKKQSTVECKMLEVWNLHLEFENIHPYELYNGKVGRVLMLNHALLVDIEPWIIPCNEGREYYFDLIRTHPSASWGLDPPV
jgi:hypothetical protein